MSMVTSWVPTLRLVSLWLTEYERWSLGGGGSPQDGLLPGFSTFPSWAHCVTTCVTLGQYPELTGGTG